MLIKVFVHAERCPYSKKWEFVPRLADMSDMSGFGHVVETIELEFEFNEPCETELVEHTVRGLRKVQQKIRADAEVQFQNIEQQIQEMLCIEDKSGEQEHGTFEVAL